MMTTRICKHAETFLPCFTPSFLKEGLGQCRSVGARFIAPSSPALNPSFRKDPVTEARGNKEVGLWKILPALLGLFLLALPALAENPALPNFHPVAPGIWRGAAPTDAGLKQLKAMGVKTIIDLRISPKLVKKESAEARRMGFQWINLPMGAEAPTPAQVKTFLATLDLAPNEPVFVHCQHGADRTGCMVGIYREVKQGWDFPKTWAEMRQDGFDPRWHKLTGAVKSRAR